MSLTVLSSEYLIEKRNVLNEMLARSWTVQELRFFAVYLSRINARSPEETRLVRFSLNEFKTLMDLKRAQKKDIKPVTDRLLKKLVHVPLLEERGYRSFQLFKECLVTESFVEIDAHDKALPLMFEFKSLYFTYPLWNIIHLQSVNQHRMYEILKQYEKLGERTTSLEQLRELLGVEPTEYIGPQGWKNFRIRVLNSCQKALAEHTDINFTYKPIRGGRKGIVAVKFIIEKNDDYDRQITFDDFVELSVPTSQLEDKPTTKQEVNDRKEELARAKKKPMWYFALETAKSTIEKNKSIKATPERYAIGILKKWEKSGYEHEGDLRKSGEISSDMKKPSFDLEEIMRLQNENNPTNSR